MKCGPILTLAVAFALLAPSQGVAATAPQGPQVRAVPAQVAEALPLELASGDITLRFAPGDSAFAAAVLQAALGQAPFPAVSPDLPGPLIIFLPTDEATLNMLLEGRRPEWSAALALPASGWIILPSGRGEATGRRDLLGEVLRHELAHIALHRAVDGFRGPRWFVEGYAQWAAGWSTEEGWRLRVALATNDSLSLNGLSLRWPADQAEAEIAYQLSATAVEFLARGAGERGIRVFLERWRDSGDFEGSLRRVFGFSSSQLEESWREWVKERYGWLFVVTRSGVGWGILAGVLIALVWARRRYRKDRMAELRARELPDNPDWWVVSLRDPDGHEGDPTEGTDPDEAAPTGSDQPPLGVDPSERYP